MKIRKTLFKKIYDEALEEILKIRPIDEELKLKLSRHEYGYKDYDFTRYLKRSWWRAYEVYKILPEDNEKIIKILDLGGFFGNFALCFKKLGYDLTVVDAYNYYDDLFDKLVIFLKDKGINVKNLDFTNKLPLDYPIEKYDVILCLAVLEHLADSPKTLMNNIKQSLKEGGEVILEVPNIAYWPHRTKLLKGQSILSPIEAIYKSEVPFTGHHHEYTKKEIEKLAYLSGFKIKKMIFYNYSVDNWLGAIIYWPIFLFNSCKETILTKLK